MSFLIPPPRHHVLTSPVSKGFMESMGMWAAREWDAALGYYEARRDRKTYLKVKYQLAPFMILVFHPKFAEIYNAPMEKLIPVWNELPIQLQRMFSAAAKYYREEKRH